VLFRILKIACIVLAFGFFVAPAKKLKEGETRRSPQVMWIAACFWLIAARLAQAEEQQKKLLAALEHREKSVVELPPGKA
jgi:hypothetical protein